MNYRLKREKQRGVFEYIPSCVPSVFRLTRSSFIENERSMRRYKSMGKLLAGCT